MLLVLLLFLGAGAQPTSIQHFHDLLALPDHPERIQLVPSEKESVLALARQLRTTVHDGDQRSRIGSGGNTLHLSLPGSTRHRIVLISITFRGQSVVKYDFRGNLPDRLPADILSLCVIPLKEAR